MANQPTDSYYDYQSDLNPFMGHSSYEQPEAYTHEPEQGHDHRVYNDLGPMGPTNPSPTNLIWRTQVGRLNRPQFEGSTTGWSCSLICHYILMFFQLDLRRLLLVLNKIHLYSCLKCASLRPLSEAYTHRCLQMCPITSKKRYLSVGA